jgi:hypothetical protein
MAIVLNKQRIISTSPTPRQTWDRPSDWLDMPVLSQGDSKICLLVKVYQGGNNFHIFKAAGDYTVDWGDGTANTNHSSGTDAEHEFLWANAPASSLTSKGYRQVIVTITPQPGSTLTSYGRPSSPYHATGDTVRGGNNSVISAKIASTTLTSLYLGFYQYNSLEEFEYVGTAPNLTNASSCFSNCVSLKIVRQWDTSAITNISSCFTSCHSLISVSPLDTSSNTNFSSMFGNCRSIDYIPPMDVSSATSLNNTFQGCLALSNIPVQDFTGIISFSQTFSTTAIRIFDKPLPSVTSVHLLLDGCSRLEVFTGTIPNAQLTSMSYMFRNCSNLKYIKPFDTSVVTNFQYCFNGVKEIRDFGWVDTSSGQNFKGMLASTNVTDASWLNITSNATILESLFDTCYKLVKIPATINCNNVTSINYMFRNCQNLKQAINLANTGNIVTGLAAFHYCYSLDSVSNFSGTFTNCQQMFTNCYNLEKIPTMDISGCNSGNETYQFASNCRNLRESGASGNTSKVDYASCGLTSSEIEQIFTNLGTVSSATIINVSNNPGSAGLSGTQIAIATGKGWTVTS